MKAGNGSLPEGENRTLLGERADLPDDGVNMEL